MQLKQVMNHACTEQPSPAYWSSSQLKYPEVLIPLYNCFLRTIVCKCNDNSDQTLTVIIAYQTHIWQVHALLIGQKVNQKTRV